MATLNSILLVDDDPIVNYLNTLLLTRLQIADQLLVATNGHEALATLTQTCTAASTSCPALILLDLNMPVMSGLEFLAAYQQLPLAQHDIWVVVLTTSANPHDLQQVGHFPVAGTITKPLTEEKMQALMHAYFPAATPPLAPPGQEQQFVRS